jgi:hypothetical protein
LLSATPSERATSFPIHVPWTFSVANNCFPRLLPFASILNAIEKTKTRNFALSLSNPESTVSADTTRLLGYCHQIGDTRVPLLRQWLHECDLLCFEGCLELVIGRGDQGDEWWRQGTLRHTMEDKNQVTWMGNACQRTSTPAMHNH